MKHIIKIGLSLLVVMFSLLFVQCKDNHVVEKVHMNELKLENKTMNLRPGDTEYVKILSGNNKYKVISKDNRVADVSIEDEKIKVRAINPGKTSIILFDLVSEENKTMDVTVLERIPSIEVDLQKTLVLLEKETADINILSGSGEYEIGDIENPNVISAKVVYDDNKSAKVVVTAKGEGDTLLDIVDSKSKLKTTVSVRVEKPVAPLMVSKSNVKIMVSATTTINITSGSGQGYQIDVKPSNIASASLNGTTITIKGLEKGNATLTVADNPVVKGVRQTRLKEVNIQVIPFENASAFVVDGIKYDPLDAKTVEVASNRGNYKGQIVIPSKVEHNGIMYTVVGVGISAFEGCKALSSVKLPETIKIIKKNAFKGCSKLVSLNLPDAITTIGVGALFNTGLKRLLIPASLSEIEDMNNRYGDPEVYFLVGTHLKSLTISPLNRNFVVKNNILYDKGMTTIFAAAVEANFGIIRFPRSLEIVQPYAFAGCQTLKKVLFERNIAEIRENAFQNCKKLTDIVVGGDAINWIGDFCFAGCNNVKTLTMYSPAAPEASNGCFNGWNFSNVILYVPLAREKGDDPEIVNHDYYYGSRWEDFTIQKPIR